MSTTIVPDYSHWLVTVTTADIERYDDKKFQFVYILTGSLITSGSLIVHGVFENELPAWRVVLLGASVTLSLLLVPLIIALQLYTRMLNGLRRTLVRHTTDWLRGKMSMDEWDAKTRRTIDQSISEFEQFSVRHRFLHRMMNVLM